MAENTEKEESSLFDKVLSFGAGLADSYFSSQASQDATKANQQLLQMQMEQSAATSENMMKIAVAVGVGAVVLGGIYLVSR